jgi:hypothetical protein
VQAHKINPEGAEFFQCIYKLAQAAGKTVVSIDNNTVHRASAAISKQVIQRRPALFRSANSLIDVFLYGRPISTLAKLANFRELYFWVPPVISCSPRRKFLLSSWIFLICSRRPSTQPCPFREFSLGVFFARAKPPRRAQIRLCSFVVFIESPVKIS